MERRGSQTRVLPHEIGIVEERLRGAEHIVAVIGAGPAGVETARHFAKRGVPVDLFDETDRVGGTLKTGFAPGSRRDAHLASLHAWITTYPQLIRFFPSVKIDGGEGNVPFEILSNRGYSGIVIAIGTQRELWAKIEGREGGIKRFKGRGAVLYGKTRGAITEMTEKGEEWKNFPHTLFGDAYDDFYRHAQTRSVNTNNIPIDFVDSAIIYGGGNALELAKFFASWCAVEKLRLLGHKDIPDPAKLAGSDDFDNSIRRILRARELRWEELNLSGPTIFRPQSFNEREPVDKALTDYIAKSSQNGQRPLIRVAQNVKALASNSDFACDWISSLTIERDGDEPGERTIEIVPTSLIISATGARVEPIAGMPARDDKERAIFFIGNAKSGRSSNLDLVMSNLGADIGSIVDQVQQTPPVTTIAKQKIAAFESELFAA